MSFTDPSSPVIAKLTDKARDIYARSGIYSIAFKIKGFSVGTGGYEPSNPVEIKPLVTSDTSLENQVYPVTGYANFQSVETLETVRVFNCRLPATQTGSTADRGLGEIGLWAEVISSEDPTVPVGTLYLYAIGHMPIRAKTYKDVFLFRVVVNY